MQYHGRQDDAFINEYIARAQRYIGYHYGNQPYLQELIDYAPEMVWSVFTAHDQERGEFSHFFMWYIKRRLIDYIQQNLISRSGFARPHVNSVSMTGFEDSDVLGTYEDDPSNKIDADRMILLFEKLSPIEREVMGLHFLEQWRVYEIAGKYGYTKMGVHGIINRSIDKLRAMARQQETMGRLSKAPV